MMKSAIFAALIASAAAFAPVARETSSSALMAKAFENELGAQPPLGFFDPLGLVADGDQEKFERLRWVELKHGRIAMMAVVGYLTTAGGVRLPGDIDLHGTAYTDISSGFAALSTMPKAGLFQILLFIGYLEVAVMKDYVGGEFKGDFRNGFIDFGWNKQTDEWKMKKRAVELNQGRAAQMGILGLMMHECMGVSVLPPEL